MNYFEEKKNEKSLTENNVTGFKSQTINDLLCKE